MRSSSRFGVGLALTVVLSACSPSLRAAPEVKAPQTAEAIERGRYLVNAVAACAGCHSERDFSIPGGPAKAGQELAGGAVWSAETMQMNGEGFPGVVHAGNLTQHEEGLAAWTDGEILRALREGVNKDGEAIAPPMPWTNYRMMSDEDALAIIAYLRTVEPKQGPAKIKADLDFPLSLFLNSMPEPLEASVPAPATDPVSQGRYLAHIGSCVDCHSPMVRGQFVEGEEFTGGVIISEHGLTSISANLTPDKETGIGNVTEAQWIRMIREGKTSKGSDMSAIMPWVEYRHMSDADLKALYAFFQSLAPVQKDTGVLLAEFQADR